MRPCAVLIAVSLLSSSCTTTYAIPRSELTRLDGFKDDNAAILRELGDVMLNRPNDRRRAVRDVDGETHQFTADTPLALVGPPVEPEAARFQTEEQRFIQVAVDATRFQGVPLKPDTAPLVVPMAQVDHGRLREFSLGKTLLLTGGIGIAVLASVVTLGLLLDPTDGDGGDGGGIDFDRLPDHRLRF
ncbi:hypothetical protein OV208_30580 [Corallococcus sp. bb12-1]|uniref:hypothetical protein n=1 Tax=Corallococcus sp. bb12-1 TaxID=2996784 RepID=UPI00226DBA26|nr:hypothetical protein [Corallococcus sp. bb12-1]MCY1045699.1 hypothetical protein [Corallococcus sp. bb12-1]